MTVRHAALPIAALLVLGVGVYLFVEVRAQPDHVPPPPPVRDRPSQPIRADLDEVPQPAARAQTAPVRASQRANPTPPPSSTPTAGPSPALPGEAPGSAQDDAGPKLDAVMAEANKAYDRGDFEDAKVIAARVLVNDPTNVRMLRIMVSASCIDGDNAVAQAHYVRLPPQDQEQMKIRCSRYGVTFPDKG